MQERVTVTAPIVRARASRRAQLTVLATSIASLSALALPAIVSADDQDSIDYRQHIMKTLAAQVDAVQLLIEHKVPAADESNITSHTKILAMTAATAKSAFTPKAPGGRAKPAVWSNWNDFAKRLDRLSANMADLDKAASSGGVAAVAAKMQAALVCKDCHDQYREPEKK